MGAKKRSLLMSLVALVLTLSAIAGATFALFSDQVNFENHLQAGTLKITLERTNLKSYSLNSQGYLEEQEDERDVSFTDSTTKEDNVFNIDENTRIAPGSWFDAEMKITNNGSVAFNYWIKIDFKDGSNILASQIEVSVKQGTNEINGELGDLELGGPQSPVGVVVKGESVTFNVVIKFLDSENNNDAQGEFVNFDLIVYAVQATK